MLTPIRTLSILAILMVVNLVALVVGPLLPGPFHVIDGGGFISFALVIYAAGLLSLALLPTGVMRVRESLLSAHKPLFIGSLTIITAYCLLVSMALYGLSRATDL